MQQDDMFADEPEVEVELDDLEELNKNEASDYLEEEEEESDFFSEEEEEDDDE